MRIFITILMFAWLNNLLAQDNGYKSYNFISESYSAELIDSVWPTEEGYIALADHFEQTGIAESVVMILDSERSVLDTLYIPYGGYTGQHSMLKINNNKFLTYGSFYPYGSWDRYGFLCMTDAELNILFLNVVEPEESEENVQIFDVVLNEEGTLDVVVDRHLGEEYHNKSLMRIDTEGNTLFTIELEDDYIYTYFGNHFPTDDGNFIMTTRHERPPGSDGSAARVFKSTYEGEILWEVDSIISTGTISSCQPYVQPLDEEHFVLFWCKDSLVAPVGTYLGSNVNMLVFDYDGNQVEEKYLFSPEFYYILNTRVASDGQILIAGVRGGGPPYYAWFAKMNADLEFTEEYNGYVPSTRNTDLLQRAVGFDVNETPDGGLIGSGLCWEALEDGSDVQQDGFTVKIGPDGCWNPDCDDGVIISSVREPVTEEVPPLSVYPNPTADAFTVRLPFVPTQTADYVLYSPSGEQAAAGKLREQETRLSAANLAPGIYFLRVNAPDYVAKVKLVVLP